MKAKAVVGAVIAAAVLAPPAVGSEAVPLRAREGVVVSWQAKSRTAVIVMSDQKVLVVHALRRYRAGRWVRVRGVKWGSLIAGVKWGRRPWGVKWAIPMARNGTYRSTVQDLGSLKRTMALRATIIARSRTRLVVSVPGASWVIRFSRRAVWLPGPKLVNGATPQGFGTTVNLRLAIAADGSAQITTVKPVKSARVGSIVPVAGTVVGRNGTNRTLKVVAGGGSGVTVTMTVPTGVDLSRYPIGAEVSGTVMTALPNVAPILTGISRNDTFTAADSSVTTVGAAVPPGTTSTPGNSEATPTGQAETPRVPVVTPGQTAPDDEFTKGQLEDITAIRSRWSEARQADPQLVTSQGLFTGQQELLAQVNASIAARQRSLAVLQLVAFELVVGAQREAAIAPTFKSEIISSTTALRIKLLTTM